MYADVVGRGKDALCMGNSSNMGAKKHLIAVFACVLLFAVVYMVVGADSAYAWKTVNMKDGDTFDVGTSDLNTTININDSTIKKGNSATVRLKGSTQHCKVHISVSRGKEITVKLADGLKIRPNRNANVLKQTPAIRIDEDKNAGGTVRLVTEAGAKTRIDGYYGRPAIEKDGTKTMLIFDTEDSNNPGTLRCEVDTAPRGTSAIGAYGSFFNRNNKFGNVYFNGGKIQAMGSIGGTGIGCDTYADVGEITFDGADVYATTHFYGSMSSPNGECGAGIGGNLNSNVEKITINSGTVRAEGCGYNDMHAGGLDGELGPGIGTGNWGTVGEIEINGGKVIAMGGDGKNSLITDGACGIGAPGAYARRKIGKITINDGDVTAHGGLNAAGIGGPSTNITINGGKVDASARPGGVGIGVLSTNPGDGYGNITINGGEIKASGGRDGNGVEYYGSGIGTGMFGHIDAINITGATLPR